MRGDIFVDTNILVYAHDLDAGVKHLKAKTEIVRLWRAERRPWLSVQVLQEFFVNLRRQGVPFDTAEDIIHNYANWQVVNNTVELLYEGMRCARNWNLSLWDGLIIAAAVKSGAEILLSEDFNPGQNYHGLKVVNPFL